MITGRLKKLKIIGRFDLWRINMRSFFIQGSWNSERMLALGFCYALMPVLHRLYDTKQERRAFLERHLEFFNAHPYTSSWLLGAIAKLEQEAVSQRWENDRPIHIFKERLYGPMGAIGDTLFWKLLKPVAAMVGILASMLFGIVGIAIFLVLYNVPHIWFRYSALVKGYNEGFDLVRHISVRRFQKLFARLKSIGILLVGALIFACCYWGRAHGVQGIAVFALSFGLSLLLLVKTRITPSELMIALLVTSFTIAAIIT